MKINTGKTISQLRKSHNLTQQQIADILNVSRPTYTAWEKNSGEISLSKILCLLKIYKVQFSDFIRLLELENGITLLNICSEEERTHVFIQSPPDKKKPIEQ